MSIEGLNYNYTLAVHDSERARFAKCILWPYMNWNACNSFQSCSLRRYRTLIYLFLWTVSFPSQTVLKNNYGILSWCKFSAQLNEQTFNVFSIWIKRTINAYMYHLTVYMYVGRPHQCANKLQSNDLYTCLVSYDMPYQKLQGFSREMRNVYRERRSVGWY